jgi:hypothetical protein
MLAERTILTLLTLLMVMSGNGLAAAQETTPVPPTPPTQPATGPGGAEYRYDLVIGSHYGPEPDGITDAEGYWIFEPSADGVSPIADDPLPLVILIHGYFGTDPIHYRAWIQHIVRRGAVLVYPDYQPLDTVIEHEETRPTRPQLFAALHSAISELSSGEHAQVDLAKVAVTGHSWGSWLTMEYAAAAEREGLPVPSLLMPTMAGCECDLSDLSEIPSSTRVLVVVGTQDSEVGQFLSRKIWNGLAHVPVENKDYIRIAGDFHGRPMLEANHGLPATDGNWGPLDALDWYGTWKLLDAAMSCTFDGADCESAFGDAPAQRFMGEWSDGVPATELQSTDEPFA